jgi:hypothetical protein
MTRPYWLLVLCLLAGTAQAFPDSNGDGVKDLMDVRAIQIRDLDPLNNWEPRRATRTMTLRAKDRWAWEGEALFGDTSIEFTRYMVVTVRDVTGHILLRTVESNWVTWIQYPADLEVEIEADVRPVKLRVTPLDPGYGYAVVMEER